MRLALTHRRLAVLMGIASLLAFAGGAGVEPLSAVLAGSGLLLALFWHPSRDLSDRMERAWLPLALLLVVRALIHVFFIRDDVVIPVVDLLFLLLVAESLRSLDAGNDTRLYSLSFALLLAATAYRPGLLFALAFLAYVVLATVTLMVGHLRRLLEENRSEAVPLPRSFLATTAALSGVTLLFSALVFLTFPRVSQGWAGRGQPFATSIAGFSDQVTLGSHGAQIYGNPQIVLRVEFPQGPPPGLQSLYWRGRSYDRFDGVRWSRSERIPPSLAPTAWYEAWGGDVLRQRIYAARLDVRVLFGLHPLLHAEMEGRAQPLLDNAGDLIYLGSNAPVYDAFSMEGRPSPQALREAERGFVPARGFYTQLPELSLPVMALADSLLAEHTTVYDRARALEEWFQREFTYTLELPATPREATLEHFLFQRRAGHCEYFSTAMVVLLRTQGIVAREVNGFMGGEWSDLGGYLAVTQNQAHAWVEVWFPGYGWVHFDPTPAGSGGTVTDRSWLWPGRVLFDAVQHRWNKWVLDYSIQSQFGLLDGARGFLDRATQPLQASGSRGPGQLPGSPLTWALAALALAGAGLLTFRRKRVTVPPAARPFLRLRAACHRAGVPGYALHSPHSLTRFLENARHPGAPWARVIVDIYLRLRFSGRGGGPGDGLAMDRALREARRALRRTPLY